MEVTVIALFEILLPHSVGENPGRREGEEVRGEGVIMPRRYIFVADGDETRAAGGGVVVG